MYVDDLRRRSELDVAIGALGLGVTIYEILSEGT